MKMLLNEPCDPSLHIILRGQFIIRESFTKLTFPGRGAEFQFSCSVNGSHPEKRGAPVIAFSVPRKLPAHLATAGQRDLLTSLLVVVFSALSGATIRR